MCPATEARQAALRNSSRSLPAIFFSAEPQAPDHPAHGGFADRHAGYPPQELATLGEGGSGSFFEVRFQEPPGALVQLRFGSGTLLGGEGVSLLGQLGVALD
jgi:hypothetical protein